MPNSDNYKEQGGDVSVIKGELKISGGTITADGSQASHIADIANDASGTVIATAVNAILAALEGVGITASE